MENTVFLNKFLRAFTLTFLFFCLFSSLYAQNSRIDYSTLYNDAIRQIDEKNYKNARKLLSKAIQLKPDYAEAFFARGTCSLMLKEWDLACNDFEKSAAMNWQPANEYLSKYCGANSYGRKVNKSKN